MVPLWLSGTIIFNKRSFTTNDRWFQQRYHYLEVTLMISTFCVQCKKSVDESSKMGRYCIDIQSVAEIFTRPFLDDGGRLVGCAKWLINGLDSHLCKIRTAISMLTPASLNWFSMQNYYMQLPFQIWNTSFISCLVEPWISSKSFVNNILITELV